MPLSLFNHPPLSAAVSRVPWLVRVFRPSAGVQINWLREQETLWPVTYIDTCSHSLKNSFGSGRNLHLPALRSDQMAFSALPGTSTDADVSETAMLRDRH